MHFYIVSTATTAFIYHEVKHFLLLYKLLPAQIIPALKWNSLL